MASPRFRLRLGSQLSSSAHHVPAILLLVMMTCRPAAAMPLEPSGAGGPSEIPVEVQMPTDQVIYDQRQNGTENLRVQMSGVTVVLAPAEALMSLAPQDLIDSQSEARPKLSHPSQPKSRLSSLLLGFLNKNHR